ncbi:MAG TPA: AAA family ATPase [Candidatus Limnocylindrales bacterium]|nr:AAA family ATPase [Candidatus Limnocylindrales bacterium]
MVDVLGRITEQAALDRFVTEARTGARGLAIEGEAGIGKSTLWASAVAAARSGPGQASAGLDPAAPPAVAIVLEARPASPEVRLSFSGLVDLFEPVADTVLGALPGPQRQALEVALYRSPAGDSSESGLVGVAVLTALRALARQRPVVVAIDDLQWLDAATSIALQHAVRRLRSEPIGLLTATRTGPDVEPAVDLVGLLAEDAAERLHLGPLPMGAIHHLIRTRLDVSLPRPTLVRLHADAGGNPLYALELARHAASAPDHFASDDKARVPSPLADLLRQRLAGLAEPTRAILLVVALAGGATLDEIARAAGIPIGDARARLEPARRDGLLERSGNELRISHPLIAAAIADSAEPDARRSVHRRLAELADEPETRARHLAAGASQPDPAVAAALSEAAEQALARGAIDASVELLDEALRHWPADDGPGRRPLRVKLAERTFLAGDTARAHRDLEALLPELVEPDLRVHAAILLGTIVFYDGDSRVASQILLDELVRTDDRVGRGRIHARLSWTLEHDLAAAAEHSRLAVETLDPAEAPDIYSFALMNLVVVELELGRGADHEAMERGHQMQERAQSWDHSSLPANWAKWFDDFERSRVLNHLYLDRGRQTGDESSVAQLLSYLVELEAWTGHMDLAEVVANDAVAAAEQTGQPSYLSAALARRAFVSASLGRLADARVEATRATQLGVELSSPLLEALGLGVLGFIELSAGAPEVAARHTDRALLKLDETGMFDHPMFRFHADQIEAHVRIGELDVAERLLDRQRDRQRRAPRPWLALTAARTGALLAAARGDVPGAVALVDEALAIAPTLAWPMEIGRTWLVAAEIRRRAGQRKAAGAAVAEAIGRFESIGAAAWLARARRDAAALGIDPSEHPDSLTPSEDRVARLAAGGMTNREIAARLAISPKTVEASLARTYHKLGIRRRAELATRLARET